MIGVKIEMKIILTLAASLLMTSCSGITNNQQMNLLPDTLQMGQNLLEHGDIIEPAPDITQCLGTRQVQGAISLDAYQVPTGEDINQFKILMVTRDDKGTPIDSLDLGEFHTSEPQKPLRLGGNRIYTTDATVTIDDSGHVTRHVVMKLNGIYLKDHSITELWRVEWEDRYEITADGRFHFVGRQETYRTEGVDDPMIEEFKSLTR